jgi:glucokinase
MMPETGKDDAILVADIGGTNCRFALFAAAAGLLRLCKTAARPTAGLRTINDLFRACDASGLGLPIRAADIVVLAVAGPVDGPERGRMTNADLLVDPREADPAHAPRKARVINDFHAQALASLTEPGARASLLLPASPPPPQGATRGFIGAGTGLGAASLIQPIQNGAGGWIAVPAEMGQTAFAFIGQEEEALHAFIRRETGSPYARGDDVLTGRGLSLLHRFLAGTDLAPEAVSSRVLTRDTPTRRWYARLYGRACRNWALTVLCRGGLYICGGIAAKNPQIFQCPEFVEEFYNSPHYAGLLHSIPVFLNADEHSGLWGAAQAGVQALDEERRAIRTTSAPAPRLHPAGGQ